MGKGNFFPSNSLAEQTKSCLVLLEEMKAFYSCGFVFVQLKIASPAKREQYIFIPNE